MTIVRIARAFAFVLLAASLLVLVGMFADLLLPNPLPAAPVIAP